MDNCATVATHALFIIHLSVWKSWKERPAYKAIISFKAILLYVSCQFL
jgi:hypothetical protein